MEASSPSSHCLCTCIGRSENRWQYNCCWLLDCTLRSHNDILVASPLEMSRHLHKCGQGKACSEIAFTDWGETKSLIRFALFEIQVWMGGALLVYLLYGICCKKVRYIVFPCSTPLATMPPFSPPGRSTGPSRDPGV